jgi:hypothetical protein
MTRIKTFIIGALVGTIIGAAVFGAIFHLLLVAFTVLGVTVVGLGGRCRLLARRDLRRSLQA